MNNELDATTARHLRGKYAIVGIGSRLRILFKDAGNDIAIPLWTLDENAQQPASPWRYPDP